MYVLASVNHGEGFKVLMPRLHVHRGRYESPNFVLGRGVLVFVREGFDVALASVNHGLVWIFTDARVRET